MCIILAFFRRSYLTRSGIRRYHKNLLFFRFVHHTGSNEYPDCSNEHQVICPGCGYCFTVIHDRCEKDYDGTDQDQGESRRYDTLTSTKGHSFSRCLKPVMTAPFFSLTTIIPVTRAPENSILGEFFYNQEKIAGMAGSQEGDPPGSWYFCDERSRSSSFPGSEQMVVLV